MPGSYCSRTARQFGIIGITTGRNSLRRQYKTDIRQVGSVLYSDGHDSLNNHYTATTSRVGNFRRKRQGMDERRYWAEPDSPSRQFWPMMEMHRHSNLGLATPQSTC